MQRMTAAAASALVVVIGCSDGASVAGKVTFNDQPLTSGTVTFHPKNGGPTGVGTIGADGRYEIRVGAERSLPPGEYVVTVDAYEPMADEPPPAKGPPPPPKAPQRLIPEHYGDQAKSGLRTTINAGSNTFNMDLKGVAPGKGKER